MFLLANARKLKPLLRPSITNLKKMLHYLKKDILNLDPIQSAIALATGAGCVSPWKSMCVSERLWAFPQIDLGAHVSALKSISLHSPPV